MIRENLVVQPRVAERQPHLLQHVENEREFLICVGVAREPLIEDHDSQKRFAIENRNGDFGSEELKLLRNLTVGVRFLARRAQDASLPVQAAADARA